MKYWKSSVARLNFKCYTMNIVETLQNRKEKIENVKLYIIIMRRTTESVTFKNSNYTA